MSDNNILEHSSRLMSSSAEEAASSATSPKYGATEYHNSHQQSQPHLSQPTMETEDCASEEPVPPGREEGEAQVESSPAAYQVSCQPSLMLQGQSSTAQLLATERQATMLQRAQRRDYLHSLKPTEREVIRGLAPNPTACYPSSQPTDLDLEAGEAAAHEHVAFVRKLRMRTGDMRDYIYSIHSAVESEKFAKHLRCATDGGVLNTKKTIQSSRGKNGAGVVGGIWSKPPKYNSDGEEESDDETPISGKKCFNPFRLIANCFTNLCCYGNKRCCHHNIIPLAGEFTNGNCRSPILCAVIISIATLWILGAAGVANTDTGGDDGDDFEAVSVFFEPYIPLLSLFMTVAGAGPISYTIGLVGSSFSFYRSIVELYSDADENWLRTMYTHLVAGLAGAQLGIIVGIGVTISGKFFKFWLTDLLQSIFGSVDGEDEALAKFLYARRLINWRPPLCVSHWKAKLKRQHLDPGKKNRFSQGTRFINMLIDVPLSFLKIPVKLDWSLPPQCPDTDTNPRAEVPVIYTISLTIIGILIIVCLNLLFMGFDTIRPQVKKVLKAFVTDNNDTSQLIDIMDKYNIYVAVTITMITLVLVSVMLLQLKTLVGVVGNVRKGGCNGSKDPKKKIEQIRYAGPYRTLDAVSMIFFTFCIFVLLFFILIPLFNGFWLIVFVAPSAVALDVIGSLFDFAYPFVLRNVVIMIGQWLLVSRLMTDSTSLKHPRLFAFISPIVIVLQLAVNFVRVIFSFLKTLLTIPLMFVLPFSYPNSPLYNPIMAIIFFNDEANNSLKNTMTAYFLARSQMHQILFLGENFGIRSGSFKVTRAVNAPPATLHASIVVESEGGPQQRIISVVPSTVKFQDQPVLSSSKLKASPQDGFDCLPDRASGHKTKLIYVSLKAFGEAELYQSQRHLVRLWVLLDYFPERFPRSLTPSASLHPSLERVIFEELLEYVSWVLEPRQTTLEAQILDKSPHYHYHLERDANSNISPAIRDLWRTTVPNEYARRVYKKTIVTSIMVAHGLIVTEDSLRGVGDDTAARMVAVASPLPYCHLSDVSDFTTANSADNSVKNPISSSEEVMQRSRREVVDFGVEGSTAIEDDDKDPDSVKMLWRPNKAPNVRAKSPTAAPKTPLVWKSEAELQKERKDNEKLAKAIATLYEIAVADFYEILEIQHETRLEQLRRSERAKKAWLINALEHPDSVLIPLRVWGGSEDTSDYLLPEGEAVTNRSMDDGKVPNISSLSKGKLLAGSYLASISPKGPQAVARDRACWRWRLALTLMLYPELRRDRKHYLRLNGFTPAKPLSFDPTGF